ncbi:IS256 family transposase [Alloalcanivorax xenomutans]|uniref:Mutator family transposase n=1 Tax=Alloalcanivorax xenomutans TaxID=1094342 RepID=A0A9Q3ZDA5_9GAMM|nr:IS256 family transposase [Alloalcanivorax xenomutans]MCE7509563.1 IS256 family transposase [Alloalcanivorax xenomutans]MCE7525973.1 IS256 family transposase [Alloalcanivorax xenomutans]
MARRSKPTIDDELIDQLLEGREHSAALLGNDGLIGELKKRLAERMLSAEMEEHLDGEEQQAAGNHRNGYSRKSVTMADDQVVLDIPRDRNGQFDPLLIPKYARRFPGFDDKIIALYARGMSTRDIQAHVEELYGITVSPSLVSAVTEAVMDEAVAWQNRPLEATYAIVYFDALRVKIRDEGLVRNKAVYLAIGVTCAGTKEVLGLWIEQTEGAKFWMRVMTEIRGRGTTDILIAVVDGLKGFPEAITAVFPATVVQTCIVHLIRYSMQFASWKERKAIAKALRPVYAAPSAQAAAAVLDDFEEGPWGQKYPPIAASWRRKWEQVIPFFAFSPEVRKILYTTNAIESLHSQIRKTIRNKGHFPHDEAATKLIYLSLRQIEAKWKRPPKEWHAAKSQLAIQFGERFTIEG